MPLLANTRKGRQQAKKLKMQVCAVDALGCVIKVGIIRGEKTCMGQT